MVERKSGKKPGKPVQAEALLMASISREDQAWGVRLVIRPLSDPKYLAMEISADVSHPRPNRNPEIKVWFSSVPVPTPLPLSDANIWAEALRAVLLEARNVADELKGKAAKKAAKKAPKKAPRKK